MPNINYFTYNFSIEALYDTEATIGNTMLYQTTFELVKGTDNQIFIHLKNHDRKAVYLPGKHIYAYLINQEEDRTYYAEKLDIIDSSKGKYNDLKLGIESVKFLIPKIQNLFNDVNLEDKNLNIKSLLLCCIFLIY